jgi:hypothetical protein
MSTSDTIAPSSVDTLRVMVGGDVFAPGDQGYDQGDDDHDRAL